MTLIELTQCTTGGVVSGRAGRCKVDFAAIEVMLEERERERDEHSFTTLGMRSGKSLTVKETIADIERLSHGGTL